VKWGAREVRTGAAEIITWKKSADVFDGDVWTCALQVKHMRATYGSNVAFTLMNSFSTSADTRAFLQQRHGDLLQEASLEFGVHAFERLCASCYFCCVGKPQSWC